MAFVSYLCASSRILALAHVYVQLIMLPLVLHSVEFILTGLLRQEIDVDAFRINHKEFLSTTIDR